MFAESTIPLEVVRRMDEWLDFAVSQEYKEEPMAQDWARISKVAEELGEAIQEFIAYTGQNPRKKNRPATIGTTLAELCDVIITGVLAIQHFTKNAEETDRIISGRWRYREDAMVKAIREAQHK